MAKIDWVVCIDEMYQGMGFPPYQWSKFDSSPWHPMEKPLDQTRLALISSAGIFREDQEPFDPWAVNDLSFRRIPAGTPSEKLKLHHNYFDHRAALKDLNCVLPMDRLAELEKEGFIGGFVPEAITLGMGRLYKRTALQKGTVPDIVDVLKGHDADAVLLVAA